MSRWQATRERWKRALIGCNRDDVPTLYLLFHLVEYEVQQLVEPLEHTCHCSPADVAEGSLRAHVVLGKGERTFTPACELYTDTRIHVLGKIENRLAFGFVEGWLGALRPAVASATRCGSASLSSSDCATALGMQ